MPGSCQLTTQISPLSHPGVCSQADTARKHKEAEGGQEPQEPSATQHRKKGAKSPIIASLLPRESQSHPN